MILTVLYNRDIDILNLITIMIENKNRRYYLKQAQQKVYYQKISSISIIERYEIYNSIEYKNPMQIYYRIQMVSLDWVYRERVAIVIDSRFCRY